MFFFLNKSYYRRKQYKYSCYYVGKGYLGLLKHIVQTYSRAYRMQITTGGLKEKGIYLVPIQ